MERPVIGSIVVVEFPFSGYAGAKKRPAFVIGNSGNSDIILCQITSKNYHRHSSVIGLSKQDFVVGSLPLVKSFIRPDKIFTFESSKLLRIAGVANNKVISLVKMQLRLSLGL